MRVSQVFDEVCVELAMALLQLLAWAPPEELLWRATRALARFAAHSHDVPQLIAMVGPDPAAFRYRVPPRPRPAPPRPGPPLTVCVLQGHEPARGRADRPHHEESEVSRASRGRPGRWCCQATSLWLPFASLSVYLISTGY